MGDFAICGFYSMLMSCSDTGRMATNPLLRQLLGGAIDIVVGGFPMISEFIASSLHPCESNFSIVVRWGNAMSSL